jgi:hypothetical protein
MVEETSSAVRMMSHSPSEPDGKDSAGVTAEGLLELDDILTRRFFINF